MLGSFARPGWWSTERVTSDSLINNVFAVVNPFKHFVLVDTLEIYGCQFNDSERIATFKAVFYMVCTRIYSLLFWIHSNSLSAVAPKSINAHWSTQFDMNINGIRRTFTTRTHQHERAAQQGRIYH